MSVPSPGELLEKYGSLTPEQLAMALGFRIIRLEAAPPLAGVKVLSAYEPEHTIMLYEQPLQQLAQQRGDTLSQLEQWHIAHELYHGLSEQSGLSAWRIRETAADLWADELLVMARKV